jgi:hypothetical protein
MIFYLIIQRLTRRSAALIHGQPNGTHDLIRLDEEMIVALSCDELARGMYTKRQIRPAWQASARTDFYEGFSVNAVRIYVSLRDSPAFLIADDTTLAGRSAVGG